MVSQLDFAMPFFEVNISIGFPYVMYSICIYALCTVHMYIYIYIYICILYIYVYLSLSLLILSLLMIFFFSAERSHPAPPWHQEKQAEDGEKEKVAAEGHRVEKSGH